MRAVYKEIEGTVLGRMTDVDICDVAKSQYEKERTRLAKARERLQEYVVQQLTPPTQKPNLSLVDGNVDKLGISCGEPADIE